MHLVQSTTPGLSQAHTSPGGALKQREQVSGTVCEAGMEEGVGEMGFIVWFPGVEI